MARTTIDTWNPNFLELSPIFDSIQEATLPFTKLDQWPTLEQFSAEFKKRDIQSLNNIQIQPVKQGYTPEKFDDQYESRIFLKGELQTRLENWHDFFNATAWLQFPKIKSALNSQHFENSKTREAGTNRSPLENAIALFDECGAIIVADDEKYLDLIRRHEWKEIFWNNRDDWNQHIKCYVFGHAMHEKALIPYIGMTTHSILLKKETSFFELDFQKQISELDSQVSKIWINKEIKKTKDLQPIPLLGIPEHWKEKQNDFFYDNVEYFRPLRKNISK